MQEFRMSNRSVWKTSSGIMIALIMVGAVVLIVSRYARLHQKGKDRTAVKQDIKHLMLAMHQYHDAHNSFPPAFTLGPDGKRWHSWRALILPYLDAELAEQYRLDEPWNGPHNQSLLAQAPDVFRSDRVRGPANAASYFAVVGERTLWPADQALGIANIVDGTSNTIAIVENFRTDISWLEPKDLLPSEFLQSLENDKTEQQDGGLTVGLADGSARFLASHLERALLNGLLTPAHGSKTYRGDVWPEDLIDSVARKNPEQKLRDPVSVDSLLKTDMMAASLQKIDASRNQLWAGTFQMVWDQLKTMVNGPVVLGQPNEMLALLNASSFDVNSLSPEATIISVSNVSDQDDAELRQSIKDSFPDVEPPLQEINLQPGQWGIRITALVRKTMPFETAFHRFTTPLEFSDDQESKRVNSFGQDPESSVDGRTFEVGQVKILDDYGDDNFIVQLTTKGPQQDRIILALIPPEATLEATWQTVQDRIQRPNPKHSRPQLGGMETLQIPILDFSLKMNFTELEGQSIAGFGDGAHIEVAYLDIRLRLDETGAEFISFAEVGVVGEFGDDEVVKYDPQRVRRLIFNKPFFIAMQEDSGRDPWFMGWIANDELMEAYVEPVAAERQ
jgi:hypothetical protein